MPWHINQLPLLYKKEEQNHKRSLRNHRGIFKTFCTCSKKDETSNWSKWRSESSAVNGEPVNYMTRAPNEHPITRMDGEIFQTSLLG
jgi:hypothetical protein